MTELAPVATALSERGVRFVLIGVSGANFHAHSAGVVFSTLDRDVLLPPDPDMLLSAREACVSCGLRLEAGGEALDEPRDRWLAERVVQRRATTRAVDPDGDLVIDLALVMQGFEFEEVWSERTVFELEGTPVPVARLEHIVASKAATGRPKDHLFLAAHEEQLRGLLPPDDEKP